MLLIRYEQTCGDKFNGNEMMLLGQRAMLRR